MRHIQSLASSDFAKLSDPSVEMVSVVCSTPEPVLKAVGLLIQAHGLRAEWQQNASDTAAARQYELGDDLGDVLSVLSRDLRDPVDSMTRLLGCDSCTVKLRVMAGPMCPKFHTDNVACRMLRTYLGPGTEWIAHHQCDRIALKEGENNPTLSGGGIKQMDHGTWNLMKGGRWDDGFDGVVHRSPITGGPRLLVTLDPHHPKL